MNSLKPSFISFSLVALPAARALMEPQRQLGSVLIEKEFIHPDLKDVTSTTFSPSAKELRLRRILSNGNDENGEEADYDWAPNAGNAYVDDRSGRYATIFPSISLFDPSAMQQEAKLEGRSIPHQAWARVAKDGVFQFCKANQVVLGIDLEELFGVEWYDPYGMEDVAVHGSDGDLVQISLQRRKNGIEVVNSRATAAVKKVSWPWLGFGSLELRVPCLCFFFISPRFIHHYAIDLGTRTIRND